MDSFRLRWRGHCQWALFRDYSYECIRGRSADNSISREDNGLNLLTFWRCFP
jgi:hypothetical protein